jgi:hypothetical protein
MLKNLLMILLVTVLAASSNPAAIVATGDAGAKMPSVGSGAAPLAKTWTTGVQENEPGSQVLAVSSLTSRGSFSAEGTGFEPATGFPAPHFQCGR